MKKEVSYFQFAYKYGQFFECFKELQVCLDYNFFREEIIEIVNLKK